VHEESSPGKRYGACKEVVLRGEMKVVVRIMEQKVENTYAIFFNKFFFTPSLGLQHAPLDCSFDASALGWTPAEHRSRLTAGRARGQRFRREPERRERAEALAHRAKPGTAKTEKGRPGQRLDGKDRKRRSSGRTAIPNQLIIKQT